MSSMFFGQYLLEKGVIDRTALLDAIERQRKSNRTLVDLAVEGGFMSPARAELVNSVFRLSNRDLADICVTDGGMDADVVARLVGEQQSARILIGDALVGGGYLTSEQVEEHHSVFRAQEAREKQTLEADFNHLEETEIVRTCTELTLRHVSRVAEVPVKLREVGPGTGALEKGCARFAQAIVGDRDFCIALDLPLNLLDTVARNMLGSTTAVDEGAAIDAACELVNVVGGNACTHLEITGLQLRPEPPFSTRDGSPTGSYPTAIRVRALAGDDPFELNVFVS